MAKITLYIGRISALPNSGRPTGMFKQQALSTLELGLEGFIGDEQADRRVHGGPEKAVHFYPAAHYEKLAARFPDAAVQLIPGSLGENISSAELDENSVRIGDIYRLSNARLQVCQPRNPCWKIDDRFASIGMAAYIAEQALTGWYWRVISPGTVNPEDGLEFDEPATTALTLADAMALWQAHRPDPEQLEQLADTPGIASGWQRKILDRAIWLRQHPHQSPPLSPAFHVKPELP